MSVPGKMRKFDVIVKRYFTNFTIEMWWLINTQLDLRHIFRSWNKVEISIIFVTQYPQKNCFTCLNSIFPANLTAWPSKSASIHGHIFWKGIQMAMMGGLGWGFKPTYQGFGRLINFIHGHRRKFLTFYSNNRLVSFISKASSRCWNIIHYN